MLGSWGRGGLAIVEMGTGSMGLGRETKRGKGRAKAPEDWECRSRHEGSWVVFFIWKVLLEEQQEKVYLGIWGGTQSEGLECQAEFGLEPVGQR